LYTRTVLSGYGPVIDRIRIFLLSVWNHKSRSVVLRVGLTIALVLWCIDRFWSDDIWTSVVNADLRFLLLSILLSFSAVCVWSIRWHYALRELDHAIPIPRLSLISLMSQGASLVAPGTVGADILRAHFVYKEGVPIKQATVSIVVDRIFGFAGLFVLAISAGLWLNSEAMPFWQLVFTLAIGLTALYTALHLPETVKRWIGKRLRTLAIKQHLHDLWQALLVFKPSLKHPVFLCRQLSLSIVIQAIHATTALVIGLAFGIHLEWIVCLFAIPLVSIVSSLPISINGLGVRETAMVFLLSELGYQAHDALLIALAMTTELYLITAVGGALAIGLGVRKNRLQEGMS